MPLATLMDDVPGVWPLSKIALSFAILFWICLYWPAAGHCQARPRTACTAEQHGDVAYGVVSINDTVAAVLRRSAGGLTPFDRARACAGRVDELFRGGAKPEEVTAVNVDGQNWGVVIGRMILVLVTDEDASASLTTPAALAADWAARFRVLLSQPALMPSENHLRIPLGERRTIKIEGAADSNDIDVLSDRPDRVYAEFDAATRTLMATAVRPGRAAITIRTGGENAVEMTIPAVALIPAGTIGDSTAIDVTGMPDAPPDVLADAYGAALAHLIDAAPGAAVHITPAPEFDSGLASGKTLVLRQRIRLCSPDMIPVEKVATITLANQPASIDYPPWLLYCNNPEQVKTAQTLFHGPLADSQPWRLVYHHQNISAGPLIFHVDVINPTDYPVPLRVVEGIAEPGEDTVQVGRRAGAAFLSAFESGAGVIHDIPPHARCPVLAQRFAAGLTVSGIVQIAQLSGRIGSLQLQVSADSPDDYPVTPVGQFTAAFSTMEQMAMPDAPFTSAPAGKAAVTPYQFGSPLITRESTYAVGGPWAYVRMGESDAALTAALGPMRLYGNYGADYDIHLTLRNPTTEEKPVGIFFSPEAGSAAGIFQIDQGPIQEFDPLSPPNERRLARIVLPPGGVKTAEVRTIPLNGSSYPASIVVHGL
jgi:hypothetical protein